MLQGLRNIGQSWVGKLVVGLLFVLLIISFAIWGIGDIFQGRASNTVASVGKAEITTDAVRNAYQARLQQLSRQIRRPISAEQARLFGIDTQVLNQLVTEATLDQRAQSLGLAVSDELVAQAIRENPELRGANGAFDRARFDDLLRANNLNEAAYVREQRAVIARVQLAEALTANLPVPLAMREAAHRYGAERRTVSYIVLPPASVGELPAPTNEQLAAFYEERKGSFRAPETRALNVLALNAETLADPSKISDADAQARYEQVKGTRFGTPERRTIQQIAFENLEQANAAAERVKSGAATFEAIAAERSIGDADLTLGTFSRAEMVDEAVAKAAFALEANAVSEPVAGRFGPVILRVTEVQAESVRPYAEVADEVKREIAVERARASLNDLYDRIEDQRAGARPLPEIARELNLPLITVPAVDRNGRDKAGQPVPDLPEESALLNAAFNSDVGVDNEPLRPSGGGYVWFDVTGIEPARDRPLEEVRDQVVTRWREAETQRLLREKAQGLVERLNKGEAIETVATEVGQPVQLATDVARNTNQDALTSQVSPQIFAVNVGKAGSAAGADDGRVVFNVTAATVPPLVTTTQEAERLEEQLRVSLADDLLGQYVAQLQKELGVSIDQAAFRRAIGGET